MLATLLTVTACGADRPAERAAPTADVIFTNARILTMDTANPRAQAMAIQEEWILAAGSQEQVLKHRGPETRIVDLDGRTVIPGLNETHIHVRNLGFEQRYAVNVEPARTVADIQDMLANRLEELRSQDRLDDWRYPTTGEEGPWLFGLGWTQDRLEEGRMATRQELDQVAREIPISLDRIYRGISVNTRVFELLGIDFQDPDTWPDWFTEDPDHFEAGDIIFRDPDTGLPTGVFMGEWAPRLVSEAVPSQSLEQRVESLTLGLEYLASLGITAVVEAGSSMGEVTRVYQEAYNRGGLPIRGVIYDGWYRSGDPDGIGDPQEILRRVRALGFNNLGNDLFRVRGIKSSADGGVGARSAAVSEPFLPHPDDPLGDENFGALREPDFDRRLRQLRILADHGWELHTHAIGDVAIRQTMDAYALLLDSIRAEKPEADPRWSIIHLYLPDEPGQSVVEEMAEYGVVAAINPANLYYEGDSFARNIEPERMARHTPYRTLLDAGVVMASGSDYPNNSPDPWSGIFQMISRQHQISGEVHGPDQTIPLEEALRTFTLNGAYLTHDDHRRGSVEAGKYADLVVLDADLLQATEEEILEMASRVVLTLVGGSAVYRSPDLDARIGEVFQPAAGTIGSRP